MITFLCWYFGISISYTILLYLLLTSDKVFCWLLENGKDTQFNNYLNLRSVMLYIPITMFVVTVMFFPINFVLKTLTILFEFIGKGFVKVTGGQEEKFRLKSKCRINAKHHLKSKYNIKSGGDDNK